MITHLSLRMSHLILKLIVHVIIFEGILPIIISKRFMIFNHLSILMHPSIREFNITFIECLNEILVHSVLSAFRLFLKLLLSTHLIIFFLLLPVLLLISLLVLILDKLVLILGIIGINLLLLILINIFIILIASSHGMSSLISLNVHIISFLISVVDIALLIFIIVAELRLINIHFLLVCSLTK